MFEVRSENVLQLKLFFPASIMSGSSGMHGGGGGINGIKLENPAAVAAAAHQAAAVAGNSIAGGGGAAGGLGGAGGGGGGGGYYCNSYTPPASMEHGLLSAYSKIQSLFLLVIM